MYILLEVTSSELGRPTGHTITTYDYSHYIYICVYVCMYACACMHMYVFVFMCDYIIYMTEIMVYQNKYGIPESIDSQLY